MSEHVAAESVRTPESVDSLFLKLRLRRDSLNHARCMLAQEEGCLIPSEPSLDQWRQEVERWSRLVQDAELDIEARRLELQERQTAALEKVAVGVAELSQSMGFLSVRWSNR